MPIGGPFGSFTKYSYQIVFRPNVIRLPSNRVDRPNQKEVPLTPAFAPDPALTASNFVLLSFVNLLQTSEGPTRE